MDYSNYSIDDLMEGVRECCRCFSCPECPLSSYGARKCPVPDIQHALAVVFESNLF